MRRNPLTFPILAAFAVFSLTIIPMARGGSSYLATPNAAPITRQVQRSRSMPAKFTNRYRMEFVLIPEGKFILGSATGNDSEKPAHNVTIGQPFYIGRYEVTQWQWRAVMTTTVDEQRRKIKTGAAVLALPMAGEGDDRAAYYVSWQEAQAFVKKLNTLNDGHTYRLPSEAEWEYASAPASLKTGRLM